MTETKNTLLGLCAADLMSRQLVVVPRAMSLQGAARLLARADVSGAPVIDAAGKCIGVLSATDFMHSIEKDPAGKPTTKNDEECMCSAWQIPKGEEDATCTVEQFMTKDPVLVTSGTKIGGLARMMMDAHIHRVIVVDDDSQHPVGIVSSIDILAAVARTVTEDNSDPAPAFAESGIFY